MEQNKKIVITSDAAPNELLGFMAELKSRFCGGFSVEVGQPDIEGWHAAVMQLARNCEKPISDDVAYFIAQLELSNFRELEGTLNKMWAFANFHNRPISLALAKEAR